MGFATQAANGSILKYMCIVIRLILLLTSVARPASYKTAEMQVSGLRQPAEILVDRWGVPHIYAKTFEDAFFVQGFNAARDRLFQIDLFRRRALGELAEVLGPRYVERDRAARLFLYRGDMEKEWAAYGSEAKRIATSFAAGINAYIDWLGMHSDRTPVEFKRLGYSPSRWEPADVVRIRSHGLTGNLNSEIARARTVCKTDPENGPRYDEYRLRLEPPWKTKVPEGLDPCLPADVLKLYTLATEGVHITEEGSNNWTIGPRKSATGRPILANDPHRAYSTPSLRYLAHLSAPGFNVIGAGEPSLPGVSIGHNGTIAFGLTRFYIDQEDLYVYELNPANPLAYRYRGGWEPMKVLHETIRVKGASPVAADLLFTRHGPVIYSDTAAHRAYAVRTGWLEPGMSAYFGSASYMSARSFREFQHALGSSRAPGLNYVYADRDGNIGWMAAGLSPIRPNWDGLMPVPGDGRYEWAGFWPEDKLPSVYNPARGYVTTSNEMNLPADYPYRERKLGFEWVNESRHRRIDEVLQSLGKVSIEDSVKLQNDFVSIPGRRLAALVSRLASDDPKTKAGIALLRGWDGLESADSAQAALVEVWISRYLRKAFLQAVLPQNAAGAIAAPDMAVMLEWLEDPKGATGKRDLLLQTSLRSAWLDVEKLLGADAKAWRWGKLHQSLPPHPLLAILDPALRAKLQPGPFPTGGSPYTPRQSAYRTSDFQVTNGASFRVVLDVGEWDNSRAVNYPGQSGNPDDPHYRDLTGMWLSGEQFPLLYSRAAVEKATEMRIVLNPAGK
jgi:penicillin amidase